MSLLRASVVLVPVAKIKPGGATAMFEPLATDVVVASVASPRQSSVSLPPPFVNRQTLEASAVVCREKAKTLKL